MPFDHIKAFLTKLAGTPEDPHSDDYITSSNIITKRGLDILPYNFSLAVANGDVDNISIFNQFGRNPDINPSSFEDVWDGSALYVFPTAAETLNIISTDANDTVLGTGARTVKIDGLDANFDRINETVNMNGTTDVETAAEFIRVYSVTVITAGATGSNEGVITATNSTSVLLLGQITIGNNRTEMAIFTVPRNHTAVLFNFFISVPGSKSVSFKAFERPLGEVFQSRITLDGIEQSLQYSLRESPGVFMEKSDLVIRAKTASGGAAVTAGFNLLLVDLG